MFWFSYEALQSVIKRARGSQKVHEMHWGNAEALEEAGTAKEA